MSRQAAEPAKPSEPDKVLDELASRVVDAASEVHRSLGPGLQDSVYEQALSVELELRNVRFQRHVPLPVTYKRVAIGEACLDFLVEDRLVVEVKASTSVLPVDLAQVLSYLKLSDCQLALLINFNVPLLRHGIRRLVPAPPA
jgi:GxxExxY protein